MADIHSEKNNTNRIKVFRVKQVVFGISLSVTDVLFSLTAYVYSVFRARTQD